MKLAGSQALWLRWVLEELKHLHNKGTTLFCDNSPVIELTKNSVFNNKNKHIRLKYHFIIDLVKEETILAKYFKTQNQVVDIFTKALKLDAFTKLKKQLGIELV